jgi:hypothetical protein
MWTKSNGYRSFFMLVRIHVRKGFLIPIPIPLFLLDQTLDAVEDLAWLAEKFILPGIVRSGNRQDQDFKSFRHWVHQSGSPSQAIKLCRGIIEELRRYGKWRMAEVETRDPKSHEQVRVYVDFF